MSSVKEETTMTALRPGPLLNVVLMGTAGLLLIVSTRIIASIALFLIVLFTVTFPLCD